MRTTADITFTNSEDETSAWELVDIVADDILNSMVLAATATLEKFTTDEETLNREVAEIINTVGDYYARHYG